ncbi:MAG: sigma 54-interacting transcriptional regulator [Chloroflexi bacterium]|nr:sigma 54-interacting transcriptional regulator [Anaerolineaceae bacterium]NMB87554.1 sigma 54-interacting transcriptional regulator [Chloroflexota bacterium]
MDKTLIQFVETPVCTPNSPYNADQTLENWNTFINHRRLLPTVGTHIGASWLRCQSFLNPTDRVMPIRLGPEHLQATRATNADLISVSLPIMEDIYQHIEMTHSILMLVNNACCILEIVGDRDMIKQAEQAGFVPGALIAEQQVGTNATALTIAERIPIQVQGAEHFLQQFHHLASSAGPIFSITGRLVGALSILTTLENFTHHTLGLATAGASAIASQRQTEILVSEDNGQLTQLNAILGSISEGILMWDNDGILQHVNQAAERILNLPSQALVGRHYGKHLSFPPFVDEALNRKQPLDNSPARIHIADRAINMVLKLRFIEYSKGNFSTVLILHRESDMLQLSNQHPNGAVACTLDNFLGDSREIRRVRQLAHQAASARASVLIRGERGSGKTLLANAIHNSGPRRDEPFVICACTSVPRDLMSVELVGIEKGISNKDPWGQPGKFELSHGGTLYLQDVESLTLEAQSVLLNLLELGIVQRLGRGRPIPVDVRVIASSSADLEKLIAQGSFRADLYYRLSPFEIRMPSLYERIEDLPQIADSILKRLSTQFEHEIGVSEEAMKLLRAYSWPGNVNELEAILARAASHLQGQYIIQPAHFPDMIRQPYLLHLDTITNSPTTTLDVMEREALLHAARACGGHLGNMCQALGVSRTTLWRKLKQYNISIADYRRRGTHITAKQNVSK